MKRGPVISITNTPMDESFYDLYVEQPDTLKDAIQNARNSGYDGFTCFQTLRNLFAFVAKQNADSRYICFGTGGVFLSIWQSGILSELINGLTDNDEAKHHSDIEGLPVLSPNTLSHKKGHVILIASSFESAIIQQLENNGFKYGENVFSLMPLFKSLGWLHHCDLFRLSNFRE